MKSLFALFTVLSSSAFALTPKTDLGVKGNTYVRNHFAQYQQQAPICAAPEAGAKRVLLSAFGPFNGAMENASGSILRFFGKFNQPNGPVDAYGATRDVTINGVDYQVCFVVTSTMWDLSSAILITEMQSFAPDFVMMSGLGA